MMGSPPIQMCIPLPRHKALMEKEKGPALQPTPSLQTLCKGSAYSAAFTAGRTEIKVRPLRPFLKVT